MKEDILLEGLVYHSPNIDALKDFYEALLGIKFREEKHGEEGKKHYFGQHANGVFLELYPSRENIRSPHVILMVSDLEGILKRISGFTNGKVEPIPPYGVKILDPDGRHIYLHRSPK